MTATPGLEESQDGRVWEPWSWRMIRENLKKDINDMYVIIYIYNLYV